MSKKKLTPYLLIGGTLLLLVLAELLIPKPLDWTVTLSSEDKNPYGAYGLWKVLPDLFPEQELHNLHQTIYESDSLPAQANYLILAQEFSPDQADSRALLEKAAAGANIFIAAQHFGGSFADTLALSTGNHLFEQLDEEDNLGTARDSVYIQFTAPAAPVERFGYTLPALPAYFDSVPPPLETVATDLLERPLLIRRSWGKGSLYLSTTPLAFTNYYLIEGRNHRFIEQALSQLPPAPLYWTEFYQVGRLESSSPLRFILGQASLRWAYYFGMIMLLLFILFGLKRRQRIIPIIEPPENSSLRFAHSIGTLYYLQGDHLNLARKQLLYFKEYIRSHYRLPVDWSDKSFGEKLAKKSGKEKEEVAGLMKQAQQVEAAQTYSAKELQQLHNSIQGFYEHGRK